ncbi:MAG: F0F1 ATP synthase subunit gamma, partial [Microgenomates group bacterium]
MNLRLIKKKIKSIINVKKITKAMQLVSAVKMKKSQQLATEGLVYRQILEDIIYRVIPLVSNSLFPWQKGLENSKDQKLIIVISTNKGLCGAFNFNLFKFLIKNYDFNNQVFITVGKKAGLFISKMRGRIIASFNTTPFVDSVSAIFETALNQFFQGEVDEIQLVYNHFVSTFKQETIAKVLLPISLEKLNIDQKKE